MVYLFIFNICVNQEKCTAQNTTAFPLPGITRYPMKSGLEEKGKTSSINLNPTRGWNIHLRQMR